MFKKVYIMNDIEMKTDSKIGTSSKELTFGVDRILSNEISSKKSGKMKTFLSICILITQLCTIESVTLDIFHIKSEKMNRSIKKFPY